MMKFIKKLFREKKKCLENVGEECKGFFIWLMILMVLLGVLLGFAIVKLVAQDKLDTYDCSVDNYRTENYPLAYIDYYDNLRYEDREISYRVSGKCNRVVSGNVEKAFGIIEDNTVLDFYEVREGGEIQVECDCDDFLEHHRGRNSEREATDRCERLEKSSKGNIFRIFNKKNTLGMAFISVANESVTQNFEIAYKSVIMIGDGTDPKEEMPLVELHEILHTLGFKHACVNKNDLMYHLGKGGEKRVRQKVWDRLNRLYSFEVED